MAQAWRFDASHANRELLAKSKTLKSEALAAAESQCSGRKREETN